MEVLIERCAGMDVHDGTVVICALTGELNKKPIKETMTFGTTTSELLKLLKFIEDKKCTHVAMESTGVYWKPIWNILESGDFDIILANARHIKNVPERKTDVKDAEWIAQLLRSGLINKSFVPEEDIRDLRDLTRYRKKITQEINSEKNRIYKILEDCNIKIALYLTDIFGDTGRKILEKIMKEEKITTEDLYQITSGRGKSAVRKKIKELRESVKGKVRQHHIKMIKLSYEHIVFLENELEEIENEIEQKSQKYNKEIDILDSVPGINKKAASVIIAEIGADMSVFPTSKNLTSWAGLSPGNNESAGKKKRCKTSDGNKPLKSIMCQCAWAASNSKGTRLSYCYKRWVKRMGKKKAIIALASLMLRICYEMLKKEEMYVENGNDYLEQINKKKEQNILKMLRAKGYKIEKLKTA